jgi:hypothetical protein
VPIIPGKTTRLFYGADPVAADMRATLRAAFPEPSRHSLATGSYAPEKLDIDRLYPSLSQPRIARSLKAPGRVARLRRILAAIGSGLARRAARLS